jgi:hypothetical protein
MRRRNTGSAEPVRPLLIGAVAVELGISRTMVRRMDAVLAPERVGTLRVYDPKVVESVRLARIAKRAARGGR